MRTLISVDLNAAALVAGGGVLAVAGFVAGRWSARGAGRVDPVPEAPPVPSGVSDVLAVLGTGAIALDSADLVVTCSAEAVRRGLVRRGELVHPELLSLVREVRRDGQPRAEEFDLAVGGGIGQAAAASPVGARAARLGEHHVLLIVEDRSLSRRVDETRRDFVANVSHELKTPVGGISLLAEAVLDAGDDPETVRRFAAQMKKEADRLTRLVRDIVDLSRLQGQDVLASSTEVDLTEAAAVAVEYSRTLAEQRRIELLAIGTPHAMVTGDRELLITAIRNLIGNAIAYSESDTRVTVRTRPLDNDVEVAVTDQGRGISAADQERIFERFYRVDAARSRATGGTGLGLSIVKHICSQHGGTVTVWSAEGRGSTFTIRLPAATEETMAVGPTGRAHP